MAGKPTFFYNDAQKIQTIQAKWWAPDLENRHEHISAVVDGIKKHQSYRYQNYLRFARLYCNVELQGLDAGLYSRVVNHESYLTNRVTLNVAKSCTDTAQSKIAKSRPRPLFLTEDGDYLMQKKAKGLTQYMDGWFDWQKVYEKTPLQFRDACILGTGFLKFMVADGQVKCERVLPNEIVVDEVEGIYGEPRQMHQTKNVFREVLADLYPKSADKLMATPGSVEKQYSSSYAADMVTVRESWHLPSGEDAPDGLHAITVNNVTLLEENYTKQYFPFVKYAWSPAVIGYYGQGLVEELIGIQLEITKILKNIQLAQHLVAVPQVWVEGNSKVVSAHINNQIGGIKRYWGTMPTFMTPQGMGPEVYQYLETLYRRAYEVTGISALSASSQKPAGLNAAVALREMQDIETERFMVTAQRYEDMHLDIARMVVDMTKDLYEGNAEAGIEPVKDIEIAAADKEFMRKLKWKDINLDEDKYVLRCYPTNLLRTTPAGKLEDVQELMQAGLLDRDDALDLLDFPDIAAVKGRMTAAKNTILKLVALMLDEGKYLSPEPYMNLQMAKSLTQEEYLKARMQDAPEDRLELLRRFMDECDIALQQVQQAQMAQQMAAQQQAMPGGALPPQAMPEKPPRSDLLPNAPQPAA